MFIKQRKDFYWGAIVLDFFEYLITINLGSIDYRILFYLFKEVEPKSNITYIKQIEIAEKLFIDKGNVSRSINDLIKEQFIVRVSNGFMVNPSLFYIGKTNPYERKQIRYNFNKEVLKSQTHIRFHLDEEEKKLIEVNYRGNPYEDEEYN